MYRLYYAPGAASLLVHWLLLELDAPHELAQVDTAVREQKSAAYLALNPNGVVPTLVIDGQPRYEAAALAMLLADRHPQAGLAPGHDDPLRAEYVQWMFNLANMVQPLFRQWWYPHEPAGDVHADAVLGHAAPRIEAQWDRIDRHLAERGPAPSGPAPSGPASSGHYLLGERVCVADFYLTMLMRWSRNMPRPATDWPHLAALASRMRSRAAFGELYAREALTEWA